MAAGQAWLEGLHRQGACVLAESLGGLLRRWWDAVVKLLAFALLASCPETHRTDSRDLIVGNLLRSATPGDILR